MNTRDIGSLLIQLLSETHGAYPRFFLSLGSTHLPGVSRRAMLHDEAKYPDPFAFKPERWLLPDGKLNPDMKESAVAFGFGRRLGCILPFVVLALAHEHLQTLPRPPPCILVDPAHHGDAIERVRSQLRCRRERTYHRAVSAVLSGVDSVRVVIDYCDFRC